MDGPNPRQRVTLDGQLVEYWSREAARLDALAAGARFGWQRRRYERKAAEARAALLDREQTSTSIFFDER